MLIAVSCGVSSSLEKLSPAWGQFTSEIWVTDEFRAFYSCLGWSHLSSLFCHPFSSPK